MTTERIFVTRRIPQPGLDLLRETQMRAPNIVNPEVYETEQWGRRSHRVVATDRPIATIA